jgi:hypothetical protein
MFQAVRPEISAPWDLRAVTPNVAETYLPSRDSTGKDMEEMEEMEITGFGSVTFADGSRIIVAAEESRAILLAFPPPGTADDGDVDTWSMTPRMALYLAAAFTRAASAAMAADPDRPACGLAGIAAAADVSLQAQEALIAGAIALGEAS